MSPKCWFLCKYCEKAFSQSGLLIEHKRKMHGEELWKDCELKSTIDIIDDAGLRLSGERGSNNVPSQFLEKDRRLGSGCMNLLNMDSHRHSETAANSAGASVIGSELDECPTNSSIASCITSEDEEVTLLGSRGNSNVCTDAQPIYILETDKFMVRRTTVPCGLQQCPDDQSNSLVCPIGIKIFPSENPPKGHLDRALGEEIKKHACSYCAAQFVHRHHKELHERKHKRCRSCRVIYEDPESLKKHECATLSRVVQHASKMEEKFGESSEPRKETQMTPAIVIRPDSENLANMTLSESEKQPANMTMPESENKSANPKVGRRRSSCRFCQRRFKGVIGLNVHLRKAHPSEIVAVACFVDNQEERQRNTPNDSEKNMNLEQPQHRKEFEAQSSQTSPKASECLQENHLASDESPTTNTKPIIRPQIVSKFQLPSRYQPRSFETVHDVKMIYSPGLSKNLRLQINCGILQYVCVLCECISSHRTDAYAHLFKHKV